MENIPTKITSDFIESAIESEEYIHDDIANKYCICVLTVHNGFKVVGTAHKQFSTIHDKAVAEKSSREKAINKLWELFSFLSHVTYN